MGKRISRVMALPLDVKWADLEFEWELPAPKKKPAKKIEAKKPEPVAVAPEKPKKNRRGRGARTRGNRRGRERKRAFKMRLKELARLVAFDLLEIRAESFQENERKFREQQAREANAYSAKLTAAFHKAVKEAAEKTAA